MTPTKASVHFKIEQLLIEKQKWIDEQLAIFNVFEQTTDIIKLIHQQASERYDEQLELLHQLYNKLKKHTIISNNGNKLVQNTNWKDSCLNSVKTNYFNY